MLKKLKVKNISFIIISLLAGSTFAQQNLSAKDAVFTALANNYNVQIAHLQVDIAEKNNTWGEAGLFPTVSLGASFNNTIQDNSKNKFTLTPGKLYIQSLSPNLTANWNLFSGFSVKISKERLELLEEQSKGNALVLIENTTQDVIKAYYQAQLQKERMQLFQRLMQVSKEKLNYYELKEKYSASSSLELLQFKNQYLTDSTNYLMQAISYKNAIRNLYLLMNEPDSTKISMDIVLTDSLNFEFPLLNQEEVLSKMLGNNQNLKNQYISMELQKKQTEFQRSFLYPTLSLQLGVNPQYSWFRELDNLDQVLNNQSMAYSGTLNLRYTLFNGWKTKRAVEVSKIQEEIATLNKDNLEASLTTNMYNLLEMYRLRTQLLSISEENLDYATAAWQLALKRFANGTMNSIELATFQTNYQNTLIQHYENQYNKLDTYLEIYKMSGNLGLDFIKAND